jgi:hypothetical protein
VFTARYPRYHLFKALCMSLFEVFAGGILVGYSELESGDPPMGVAAGKLSPSPAYRTIQPSVVAAREGSQADLALAVRTADGQELPGQGGVQILDYSAELGAEGIQVHVLGIGYPLYEELFPQHVAAYRSQFSSKP